MTSRAIDLSGTYEISAIDADSITFAAPQSINPAWLYVDLDGSGTTGYSRNIGISLASSGRAVDLAGSYTIASVSAAEIELVNPAAENSGWGFLQFFGGGATKYLSAHAAKTGNNWIGPFIVEDIDTALLVANFVAMQGLFKDNGKKQSAFSISVQIEATPVDSNDAPTGPPQIFSATLPGNSKGREMRAITLVCELASPGRQSVRGRRVTNADYNYEGTVVDEVKWQDLYGIAAVELSDFGNVTTVHSRTYATEGALAVKERKINMLVTRKIPERIEGTTFSAPVPTKNAADIFAAVCLDPYIGRRSIEELRLDMIYGAIEEAVDYFGIQAAGEFSLTFDDDGLSFQETAATIAQAVFCTSFRQGSRIGLSLERATEDSVLLFNHRNKIPESEVRTTRFGNLDDHDGVELEFADPEDGAPATLYLPADRSATNPRAIKVPGIGREQAYFHLWRAWNKIRYQNSAVEFSALQEAAAVIRNDRVLIADNTRPDTQDGEILGQDGLELELSQPAELLGGEEYMIFLQLPDATVDAIEISPGSDDHHIILAWPPRIALAIGDDLYAQATYHIVRNDSPRESAFLIAEKDPEDNSTYSLRAINYSSLYYANDQLEIWLEFAGSYQDSGPYRRDAAPAGPASIVADATRGSAFLGAGGASLAIDAFDLPASYTKAAWINRSSLAAPGGSILSSAGESFGFNAGALEAGHGSAQVSAPWPAAGVWHFAALTYDAEGALLSLYIDGELADEAEAIGQRAFHQLIAFQNLVGRGDDLRLIARAISPAEILDLYRASRL